MGSGHTATLPVSMVSGRFILLHLCAPTMALYVNKINSVLSSSDTPPSSSCITQLCIQDSADSGIFPWLINNSEAKFTLTHTDSESKAVYRYISHHEGDTGTYHLHYYTVGAYIPGFWMVEGGTEAGGLR